MSKERVTWAIKGKNLFSVTLVKKANFYTLNPW